jgi:methylated-DNA-[protein]-cysteine S-methyltransferase
MKISRAYYRSPIGLIEIAGGEDGVRSVAFVRRTSGEAAPPPESLETAVRELDEYFAGARREFSVRLSLRGTEFQRRVWAELAKIPFGRTASYGEIARTMARPGAARAIGGANHLNPVSIIIPCHRVVGHDGGLVGYGGGLWRKRWLLAHEESLLKCEPRLQNSPSGKRSQGG